MSSVNAEGTRGLQRIWLRNSVKTNKEALNVGSRGAAEY
jgi:hypothetical protein